MSRIHEALKKAQEERSALQATQGTTEARVEVAEPTISDTSSVAIEIPPVHEISTVPEKGPLTTPAVLAGCRQLSWPTNSPQLVFSNDDVPVTGKEVFRTLRTRLYQIRAVQPLRTVLISSALPAEGKTFMISNLALSIARQRERRVLLIDGDIRLSRLHTALGAPSTPGLTDYLLDEADEQAILQRGRAENLYFIPGGRSVSNPTELLANGKLETLLARLGPAFDWILIDSPPVIPVSDATILAKYCDGVMLVVRAGSTPFDLAQKARNEFQDSHLIGVALNQVAPGTGYGSYYYDSSYAGAEANGNKNGKH
jgi:protein-tyrosine kinase